MISITLDAVYVRTYVYYNSTVYGAMELEKTIQELSSLRDGVCLASRQTERDYTWLFMRERRLRVTCNWEREKPMLHHTAKGFQSLKGIPPKALSSLSVL